MDEHLFEANRHNLLAQDDVTVYDRIHTLLSFLGELVFY